MMKKNKKGYRAVSATGKGHIVECPYCASVLGRYENYGSRSVKFITRCQFCLRPVTLEFPARKNILPSKRNALERLKLL